MKKLLKLNSLLLLSLPCSALLAQSDTAYLYQNQKVIIFTDGLTDTLTISEFITIPPHQTVKEMEETNRKLRLLNELQKNEGIKQEF